MKVGLVSPQFEINATKENLIRFVHLAEKDKNCESLYEQYLSLITPGSRTTIGEFSRLKV